ncbi:Sec63-domain-containing protein [Clavulina sp. PMI_390]|nr:Sec63-domain-containing protein [Clavulina sp. PMI_390]
MLPIGTTRVQDAHWEEVTIPPARTVPPKETEEPVIISKLDPLARGSFPGYTSLNRVQSIVFKTAYTSNENLLICAPTGAGKTDVAMLTILRVLDQYSTKGPNASTASPAVNIRRDDFKIIYVAPMKALAAEITRKLGKRLKWLNIIVKELTGDMQLTRAEIAETQIIVTTPEKWDVVTRKPTGEGELASKVKLLIIDEVHLLNEDRGAVIETIVARTLRQVESTQSLIRIVGLSATLPNYIDVASFLHVSPYQGLFFFDSSFRPVPLEQHFIGVKGKPNSATSKKNLDQVTFDKVLDLVRQGHQVMVFVHARKETVKTAQALRQAAIDEGALEDFDTSGHPSFELFRRDIGTSRNKEMKELFAQGFGIHHAGMLRSDRNMMERMFEARAINVLCCTATLAWGVNLPAHAVVIKGTQLYDPGKGAFVDLSVLDVLQIFGRAGRPGLEDSGEGYICTTQDKLDHYLDAITAQHPIESAFVGGMIDALNAEIALGTVSSVDDGVQWIGYTYLFVRMKRNPFAYGIPYDELSNDPGLRTRREDLIKAAAKKLVEARMIGFNEMTQAFTITDLGRIAAKYYIRHSSIEIFNTKFKPIMSEADVLGMLSMSTEFDQIQVRESELEELQTLLERVIPCEVADGTDTSKGKVNILLQGYISNAYVEDFALVSDTAYAAQNGGRIARALLEIALSKKWANVTATLMAVSKAIEKRMWPFEHPLKQFRLSADVLYNLQQYADELSPAELAAMRADDLGKLIHLNEHHGKALLAAARQFPSALISYALRPLGAELLRLFVRVQRAFEWNAALHGNSEPFWLWVEDHNGVDILQSSFMQFKPGTSVIEVDFVIPVRDPPPPSVTIRFLSDTWLGAEDEVVVSFEKLKMPLPSTTRTQLLDIPFLPISALHHPTLENLYEHRFRVLNGIQTQAFWSAYNNSQCMLLSAPASSGKSIIGQLAIWQAIIRDPKRPSLVVLPLDSDAKDYYTTLKSFSGPMQLTVSLHTSSAARLSRRERNIDVVTPKSLMGWLETNPDKSYLNSLGLVVCEGLELLDPVYELAVSILLHSTQTLPVRFIGITTSLSDSADLARWLRVHDDELYDFRPNDRDQSLSTTSQAFTIPPSSALFKAMVRPAHIALRTISPNEAAVVFVPSRGQCRTIAHDLITQCAIEMDTRGFLPPGASTDELEARLSQFKDRSLIDAMMHGIGVLNHGMLTSDRLFTLELFADGILRVLVVPREMCWTLPVRATLVLVFGTQYMRIPARLTQTTGSSTRMGPKKDSHVVQQANDTTGSNAKSGSKAQSSGVDDRELKKYSVHELVRMQGLAVRHGRAGRFHLLCQAEERDTYMRFLEEGLPLESALMGNERLPPREEKASSPLHPQSNDKSPDPYHGSDALREWFAGRRAASSIRGKQDAMDMLSHTYLWRRMQSNPTYYDVDVVEGGEKAQDAALSRFVDRLFEVTAPPAPSPTPVPATANAQQASASGVASEATKAAPTA